MTQSLHCFGNMPQSLHCFDNMPQSLHCFDNMPQSLQYFAKCELNFDTKISDFHDLILRQIYIF